MTKQRLPDSLQRRYGVETVEEVWQQNLNEGNVRIGARRQLNGMLPSNPRCVNCHRPFAGTRGLLICLRWGKLMEKSAKNPGFCTGCYSFTSEIPGGTEIELTILFVDVRGLKSPERSDLIRSRMIFTSIRTLVAPDPC